MALKSDDIIRGLLRYDNEDDAGAEATCSQKHALLDSIIADMAGVGPLGVAGPLRPFLTASRMISIKSLARLLTTGGVNGNVCRSVAISTGVFTNLNRKKFERMYLETNHQVFP